MCDLYDLGFDEFGNMGDERLQTRSFMDLDMTWPDWEHDKRLLAAIEVRVAGV